MSDAWKMNGNDDEKMGNERLKRRPGDVITVLRDGSVDLPASTFEEPPDFVNRLGGEIDASGGEVPEEEDDGTVGRTMFDLPRSEDGTVTVLLPQDNLQRTPSQALVRICSHDGLGYRGIVTAGPFAEPDGLKSDSPILTTVITRGGKIFLPRYHGRIEVTLMGEEQEDGTLSPPRFRPLPNSRVYVLDEAASAAALRCGGDIQLGRAIGYENLAVGIPSHLKSVLPRHLAILGTTGGGKSTTVSRLMQQAQAAGMAVIVLDVEPEYTSIHEPTEDATMLRGLERLGQQAIGIPVDAMTLYHLVGRDTGNPDHPHLRPFSLQFARLSPHAVAELLELTEAQQTRFFRAYDVAKQMLRDLDIFPKKGDTEQERLAAEYDEFERGYPRLTLKMFLDIVRAYANSIEGKDIEPVSPEFRSDAATNKLKQLINAGDKDKSLPSWFALIGKLSRLNRLRVFDVAESQAKPLVYKNLLKPGAVSVIDLSDASYSEISNMVIADLLRGVQEAQEDAYDRYEQALKGRNDASGERPAAGDAPQPPTRVMIIIEEAHEFLSAERIAQMPTLFRQVASIAKRGRKRGLGLCFSTQLPQHLPRQVFGLVNSYILHKITDPDVVRTLQRTVSGIDDGLWRKLPALSPGQAIVSFPHMAKPLLVAVDPTPVKLRLID